MISELALSSQPCFSVYGVMADGVRRDFLLYL